MECPRAWRVVKRKLKGQVLIDLGCGLNYGKIIRIASKVKVAKYYGVDKVINKESHYVVEGVEVNLFNKDMLEFCSKLTTNSCNFVMNGIDFLDQMGGNYLDLFIAEVTRATRRGGIVFGRGSQPIEEKLRKKWKLFTEVQVYSGDDDHFLFIKN